MPGYPSGRADASVPLAVTAASGAVPSASQSQQQKQQATGTDAGAYAAHLCSGCSSSQLVCCKLQQQIRAVCDINICY